MFGFLQLVRKRERVCVCARVCVRVCEREGGGLLQQLGVRVYICHLYFGIPCQSVVEPIDPE